MLSSENPALKMLNFWESPTLPKVIWSSNSARMMSLWTPLVMSPQNKSLKLLKRLPQARMVAYSGKNSLTSSLNVKHHCKEHLLKNNGGDRLETLRRKTPLLKVKKELQPETIQLIRRTMLMPRGMVRQLNHMGMKTLIRSLCAWRNSWRCFRRPVKARWTKKLKMSSSRRWLRSPSLNHPTQLEQRSLKLLFLSIKATI